MAKICSECGRREEREEAVFCPQCRGRLEPEKIAQPAPATGFEHCAACAYDNIPGKKFCGRCGEPLYTVCPKCGDKSSPVDAFCGECGSTLPGHNGPADSGTVSHPENVPSAPKKPKCSKRPKQPVLSVPAESPKPVAPIKATESTAPKELPTQVSDKTSTAKNSDLTEKSLKPGTGIVVLLCVIGIVFLYDYLLLTNGPAKMEAKDTGSCYKVSSYAEAKETYQVGDIFVYGSYPQGGNNEVKPIDWLVLARESDRLLVIAKFALDVGPYNSVDVDTNWSQCTLRTWLNGEFMEKAFSVEERENLLEVTLNNHNSPEDWNTVPGGPDTRDKIFLLSMDEVERYFSSEAERRCMPTGYARKQGAYCGDGIDDCYCNWWLRSPGAHADNAAGVHSSGSFYGSHVGNNSATIRPAMYLAL